MMVTLVAQVQMAILVRHEVRCGELLILQGGLGLHQLGSSAGAVGAGGDSARTLSPSQEGEHSAIPALLTFSAVTRHTVPEAEAEEGPET